MDPLRILLVEDEADTAHSTALLLRFHGHEVSVAVDGLAALELAHTNPDVVLLDIGLPGLDGYSVAEQLVENEMKPPVVIAVTGYPPRKAIGIHLHLVKPIDVNELACVLGRVALLSAAMFYIRWSEQRPEEFGSALLGLLDDKSPALRRGAAGVIGASVVKIELPDDKKDKLGADDITRFSADGQLVLEDQLQELDVREVVAGRLVQPHLQALQKPGEAKLLQGLTKVVVHDADSLLKKSRHVSYGIPFPWPGACNPGNRA